MSILFLLKQNPDSPLEMARITKAGGFVSPPPEPGLSARVWLDADFTQVGLAMGRSIGDHAVKVKDGWMTYTRKTYLCIYTSSFDIAILSL